MYKVVSLEIEASKNVNIFGKYKNEVSSSFQFYEKNISSEIKYLCFSIRVLVNIAMGMPA